MKPCISDAQIAEAQVTFLTADTTLNVVVSSNSNLLLPLSDGGIRHLLAGALFKGSGLGPV